MALEAMPLGHGANMLIHPPRILYFASRPNGILVPLIPADEFPLGVQLQGVPRMVRLSHTIGMQYAGGLPTLGMPFDLEGMEHEWHLPPGMAPPLPTPQSSPIKRPSPVTTLLKPGLPPSGTQPDQNKKEYCTYWIRTGECDYMQQGCLYKHEMPDKATLDKIGFRSVPRWWREQEAESRSKMHPRPPPPPPSTLKSWRIPEDRIVILKKGERKASTVSDLIDLSVPVVIPPTPPSTSSESFPPISKPKPQDTTRNVFVPRGESPNHHVAEALTIRRRQANGQKPTSMPRKQKEKKTK
ncbi:hypothetical protein K470DRAFT_269922 [Piedraia hortae CBS 480.64]|uniref:C3H1-type domain-containing protein n=1 Tax=Piedraia hortae CBS 480.64 TaxID=1314780 RepID=A0A6A7C2X1_9PEZI|nr:hypothetical protein K470DRAFT_269922 [Piedraia hortae CBS 480.64]